MRRSARILLRVFVELGLISYPNKRCLWVAGVALVSLRNLLDDGCGDNGLPAARRRRNAHRLQLALGRLVSGGDELREPSTASTWKSFSSIASRGAYRIDCEGPEVITMTSKPSSHQEEQRAYSRRQ